MGQVIMAHPRMVKKWAARYILLYRTEGGDFAKRWATENLSQEQRDSMSAEVIRLQKRKRPQKGPDDKV